MSQEMFRFGPLRWKTLCIGSVIWCLLSVMKSLTMLTGQCVDTWAEPIEKIY